MFVRNYIFIVLFILPICLQAQLEPAEIADKLLTEHPQRDTVRVRLLNSAASAFLSVNSEMTFKYASQALLLSDSLGDLKSKAVSTKMIGLYYQDNQDMDHALEYFKKSLEMAGKSGDKGESLEALTNLGYNYYMRQKYPEALDYNQKAAKLAEELGYVRQLSFCLNIIAIIQNAQGNHSAALENLLKTLETAEVLEDQKEIAACMTNIGITYINLENYPLALEYHLKALKINQENNSFNQVAVCYNNIGMIYEKQGQFPNALDFYNKALKLGDEQNNKQNHPVYLNNIGVIHLKQNDLLNALEYFKKSLAYSLKSGQKNNLCETYLNIGSIYLKQKKFKEALQMTQMSFEIANELHLLEYQKSNYDQLSAIYAATQNYKEAYNAYKSFKQLNDSIFSKTNIQKITGLEYSYKFEKEKQAAALEEQKRQFEHAQADHKIELTLYTFAAGFLMLMIIVFIMYRSYRLKVKTNEVLAIQKNEITEKNEQLNELNATKDKFFSIIAHDLKNPFNSILGFSDMLVMNISNLPPEKLLKMATSINNSAKSAYKLLENLLEWSRAQTGSIKFQQEKIMVKTLFDAAYDITQGIASNKNITLTTSLNENFEVFVDKNMINTVLRNLITNAIKYTNKGGEINLTGQRIQKTIFISVMDNGVGIAPEIIDKLFKISEKISTAGTEKEPGTGLGLLLCKEFVKKHGGEIVVKSELGKGSEFTFSLPLI